MDLRTTPESYAALAPGLAAPTDRELAVLARALEAAAVPGAAQLRDQVRMVQVLPGSDPTTRIYLVHPDAPRAPWPTDAGRAALPSLAVRTPTGRVIGDVTVWVEAGHLRALSFRRTDGQPALALPRPEWIELPTTAALAPSATPAAATVATRSTTEQEDVRARARAAGALQALTGARVVAAGPAEPIVAPTSDMSAAPATHPSPARRTRLDRRIVRAALAALALAAIVAAFSIGRSGGADLDAARADGAATGAAAGADAGEVLGAFAGDAEGRIAGRLSTYQDSFDAARTRALAQARREALARRRAAAAAASAAAAPTFVDNTSCSGYRDSRGYWVCA